MAPFWEVGPDGGHLPRPKSINCCEGEIFSGVVSCRFAPIPDRQTGNTGWAMNSRKLAFSLLEARQGSESARRELLHTYRSYLKLLARLRIGRALQSKLDESDLVQETLLNAWHTFEDFRGQTEAELMQWLHASSPPRRPAICGTSEPQNET